MCVRQSDFQLSKRFVGDSLPYVILRCHEYACIALNANWIQVINGFRQEVHPAFDHTKMLLGNIIIKLTAEKVNTEVIVTGLTFRYRASCT